MDEQGTTRSVICTPRTPRTIARQRFSLDHEIPEEDDTALDELLYQTWTIFGVSALFGFQQNDELYLKMYGKRLREEVASTLSQEDVTYNAKFTVMEGLVSSPSALGPPAVKVEVFAMATNSEKNIEKCIYKGIFLSWKTTRTETNFSNCVRLPLLLCRGTRSCMIAVHEIMSRMFDCMVIELPAKEDDLMWLVPIILMPSNKDEEPVSSAEIRMEYTVPGLPRSDTIATKFRSTDLIKMLTALHDGRNDEIGIVTILNVDHIEKFHKALHTQMLHTAGLHLGLCTLHRISLPMLTIEENKMKVMNKEAMCRILLYLNEKAVDTLHNLQFHI